MKHTLEKTSSSSYRLRVELDADDLRGYVKSAEKKISESINLRGFRKGRAPLDVIQKTVGTASIREEALQIAIADSLSKVVREEGLRLIRQEKFEIKENGADCFVYEMDLVVFPEIELAQYSGIQLTRRSIEVSDEDVNRVMGDIARLRTKSVVVERESRSGDRLTIDFDITENGKTIDGGHEESYPVILGEHKFIPEFEDQLVGLAPGLTKKFDITVPVDFPQKDIAGKHLNCSVVVHTVEELQLPVINDDFAKSIGSFGSLHDLETSIRKGLASEKERKEENRLHDLLLKTIADQSTMEVPEYLINEKLDLMLHSFDEDLHARGMEIGLYLAHLNKTQDDLRNEWKPKATDLVRMSLVAQAVAMKENIQIAESEVEAEMQLMLQEYLVRDPVYTPGSSMNSLDTQALRERVVSSLMHKKVMAFLMDQAHIMEEDSQNKKDA